MDSFTGPHGGDNVGNRSSEMIFYQATLALQRQGTSDRDIERRHMMCRRKSAALRRMAEARGWLDASSTMPSEDEIRAALGVGTREQRRSLAEPHDALIRGYLERGFTAQAIHGLLRDGHGFTGGYDSVRRYIGAIQAKSPALTMCLDFPAGRAAQVDFGQGPMVLDPATGQPRRSHYLAVILCHSRFVHAELTFRQDEWAWLGCLLRAFQAFGGVPSEVIVDNCKVAVTRPDFHAPVINRSFVEFADRLNFRVNPCPAGEPQQKGRVEATIKYLKAGFQPTLPEGLDIHGANRHLSKWLWGVAGTRIHGTTRRRPVDMLQEERPHLRPLPDPLPEITVWGKAKLANDCHATVERCRYSAPFGHVQKILDVAITEREVRLYSNGALVAVHARLRTPGQRSTVDDHYPPNCVAARLHEGENLLKAAREIGECCLRVVRTLLDTRGVSMLRAAHGVVGLARRHGSERVERGCAEALTFARLDYGTVVRCIETPPPPPAPALPAVHAGGALSLRENDGIGEDGACKR
jgi:transposase